MANNPYVNKVMKSDGTTIMDISDSTVTAADMAQGVTAYDATGEKITGTGTIVGAPIILGLEADFQNSTFTRLEDAVGLNGGSDFDNFPMYQRRRCNVADDGTINAYLSDETYIEDGSNGQVMVEQPKFYYKVVPTQTDQSGRRLIKARYYISDKYIDGYKVHPAFVGMDGEIKDYVYIGAYEATMTNNILCSQIFTNYQQYPQRYKTRAQFRTAASSRGTHWRQAIIQVESAEQLLMLIEYGRFNMQRMVGNGYVGGTYNPLAVGTLSSYGNGTYGNTSDSTEAVQWRGKENPWGNINKWVDGIIVSSGDVYIAKGFSYSDYSSSDEYIKTGLSCVSSGDYIKYYSYNASYDWLFMPYTVGDYASSTIPVGDYNEQYSGSNRTVKTSGYWTLGQKAGAFYISCYSDAAGSESTTGGRLTYIL